MMCDLRVNISQKTEIKGPVFAWARAVKERASVWHIAADGAEPCTLCIYRSSVNSAAAESHTETSSGLFPAQCTHHTHLN